MGIDIAKAVIAVFVGLGLGVGSILGLVVRFGSYQVKLRTNEATRGCILARMYAHPDKGILLSLSRVFLAIFVTSAIILFCLCRFYP
ncbi:MAG TPA: hypothetical protein VJJ80_03035 [Patescibacteria group bacterium]|nr:hypothetical protein [Patescibacteria group bacterium]